MKGSEEAEEASPGGEAIGVLSSKKKSVNMGVGFLRRYKTMTEHCAELPSQFSAQC